MIPRYVPSKPLPEFHSNLLLVKLRPSATPFTAATMATHEVLATPAVATLATFERSGLLKRVTPLARAVSVPSAVGARAMMMTFAATAAPPQERRDRNAGVSILELNRESDVAELQSALSRDSNVEFVSRVPVRYVLSRERPWLFGGPIPSKPTEETKSGAPGIAAVPPAASGMWNLQKIRWADARGLPSFREATLVKVAVLDTGIDVNHPDLEGRVGDRYVYEHPDLPDVSSLQDIIGHGTHVSGTIAALANNQIGINGICDCALHVWKIFDDVADLIWQRGTFEYTVDPVMYRRALADCIDQDIDIINLSIGGQGDPDPQELELFQALLANDTTIVAAMGNERKAGSPTSFPAAIGGVIAVGATNIDDTVANFSNRGNHISLCAPGVAIWSTLPTYPGQFGFEAGIGPEGKPVEGKALVRETDYDAWPGTSMAAPHVRAATALLFANRGKKTPSEARKLLMATADKVAGMEGKEFHPDYGAGRLNLLRLLSTP